MSAEAKQKTNRNDNGHTANIAMRNIKEKQKKNTEKKHRARIERE